MGSDADKEIIKHMNPTKELEEDYIVELDETIQMENSMQGNWILTYLNTEMNEKWRSAVFQYRNLNLIDITIIKCTTAAPNENNSDNGVGEIYFKCGPYNNAEKILNIGKNIVTKMDYVNPCGFIVYKPENDKIEKTGKYNHTLKVGTSELHEK